MNHKRLQAPIPPDLPDALDDYCRVSFCIPNTREWRALAGGLVELFSRGRFWDANTGRITEAQRVGRLIWETYCMTCSDDIKLQIALQKLLVATLHDGVLHSDDYYKSLNDSSQSADVDVNSALLSNNLLYPDQSVSDAIFSVFSQHATDLPSPLTTSIQDDLQATNTKLDTVNTNLDTLHRRFFIDGWILDQNIAEVLNNTLRVNKYFLDSIPGNLEALLENPSISDLMTYYFGQTDTSTYVDRYKSKFDNFLDRFINYFSQKDTSALSDDNKSIFASLDFSTTVNVPETVVNVTNEIALDGLIATLDSGFEDLVQAVNALDASVTASGQDTQTALDNLRLAIECLEIINIANAAPYSQFNINADNAPAMPPIPEPKVVEYGCGCGSGGVGSSGDLGVNLEKDIVAVDDCEWIDLYIDAFQQMLEMASYVIQVYSVDWIISVYGPVIVQRLLQLQAFTRALAVINATLVAGIDPSDAATLSAMVIVEVVVFLATYLVTISIQEIIDNLQANSEAFRDAICNVFMTADINIDDALIDLLIDLLIGAGVSAAVRQAAKSSIGQMIYKSLMNRRSMVLKKRLT